MRASRMCGRGRASKARGLAVTLSALSIVAAAAGPGAGASRAAVPVSGAGGGYFGAFELATTDPGAILCDKHAVQPGDVAFAQDANTLTTSIA